VNSAAAPKRPARPRRLPRPKREYVVVDVTPAPEDLETAEATIQAWLGTLPPR
jgi:hypothetical protein